MEPLAEPPHWTRVPPSDINEDKILAAANQFVSLGLTKAGYEYINIDVYIPLS